MGSGVPGGGLGFTRRRWGGRGLAERWVVTWTDEKGRTQRREFATYLDVWSFNERRLRGKGEVALLTERAPQRTEEYRSEAERARRMEGGRRYVRRRRS